MYTLDIKLSFGKYRFTKIKDVPIKYLLSFYKSYYNSSDYRHKKLIEYIESNQEILKQIKPKKEIIHPKGIGYKIIGSHVKLICESSNKIIFISEKEAKFEINRIRDLEQENKKPIRAYECEKCSGWHLTSISFEQYEKLKNRL